MLGTISARAEVGRIETSAEFVVIDGDGDGAALRVRETVTQLGVLKLGVPISSVTTKETILSDYKEISEVERLPSQVACQSTCISCNRTSQAHSIQFSS